MVESSTRRRHAFAILCAFVLATAILVAAPAAHGAAPDPIDTRSAAELADEPLLVRSETRWSRHSLGSEPQWTTADVEPGESVAEAYERLALTPGVAAVAYNYRYEAHGVPNDPLFDAQWNLQTINLPDAWDLGDGSGVVVAVLDSGISMGGEDLTCLDLVDPYNGITDVAGVDAAEDDNGHGTHVTGTIAQCTNNGLGAAGVAPGATVMPVKVMDENAQATTMTLYRGMIWAIEHGADVINLSLGMDCADPWPVCSDYVIDYLVERAREADIAVVVSSGNDGGAHVSSPANHPSTISVGATTISDVRALYSAYGPALDVVAPGGSKYAGIWQETFNSSGVWGYYSWTGTSMAAPHVSGTLALMKAANPIASTDYLRSVLTANTVDIGAVGWDEETGFGRIDVAAAVAEIRYNPGDPCPAGASCDGAFAVDAGGLWTLRKPLPITPASGFYFGVPGDVAFSGDWNCDGTRTPGLYRQSDGFVYLRYSNTEGIADREFYFGNPGDVPIAGDFNGDGCDTVSVYRSTEGRVYIINRLGEDGGGLGAADLDYLFGVPGDKPFSGDFDGDGIETIGLHRESSGLVYFRDTHTEGIADSSFIYGNPGDQILAADWNGDSVDTVGVYRPGLGVLFVKLANTQGVADHEYVIGPYAHVARAGK